MKTENGRASLRTSDVIFERKKGWMGGNKTEIIDDKRKTNTRWQHPSFEEYFGEQNDTKKKSKKKLKKENKKYFPSYIHRKDQPVDVTLWLCQNYPLKDDDIATLLEAISIASEDMRRMADIFKLKFPKGGAPVKLTMPIVVGISASATFCNFKQQNISDDVFKVPGDYR